MRAAVLGLLVACVTTTAAVLFGQSGIPPAQSQQLPVRRALPEASAGSLVALSTDADERTQQLVVVDAVKRTMAVYHIDKTSGQTTLKSVRQIRWDLEMEEFNGVSPLPREIRSLVEQR